MKAFAKRILEFVKNLIKKYANYVVIVLYTHLTFYQVFRLLTGMFSTGRRLSADIMMMKSKKLQDFSYCEPSLPVLLPNQIFLIILHCKLSSSFTRKIYIFHTNLFRGLWRLLTLLEEVNFL